MITSPIPYYLIFHLFLSRVKVCAWRCKAWELFTWSTWKPWWKEALSCWSGIGYVTHCKSIWLFCLQTRTNHSFYHYSIVHIAFYNCTLEILFWCIAILTYFVTDSASRWKDSSSGQHVEYDQRPDIFRFVEFWMSTKIHLIQYIKNLLWQGDDKICECACTFRSNWE